MKQHGVAVLLLAGCSFPTPSEQYACVTTADCEGARVCDQGFCVVSTNAIDGPVDVPPDTDTRFACAGWLPRHFDPCMIPQPTGPLALSAAGIYIYDTTDGSLTDPMGMVTSPPNLLVTAGRVLSIDSLDLGAASTLRVIGTRPLVVAAWTTISVAGTIDAASTATSNGAGANPTACVTHAASPGTSETNGAGGGGGGGFGAPGARGGHGDLGTPAAAGGPGGTAVAMPLLLGGCAGGTGGTGDQPGGTAGPGGGAVQLTARMELTIAATGRITAGGSGGGGAPAVGSGDAQGGGGGGGTGGMLGLQGASIAIAGGAILASNGGGGGGGAGNGGAIGTRGQGGQLSAARASGGVGGAGEGDGGTGGAGILGQGLNGINSPNVGGGGGGGGVGFIVFTSATAASLGNGAVVSPAATIVAP